MLKRNIGDKVHINPYSNITGVIPANLFDNCQSIIDFSSTFKNCSQLTGAAPNLWARTNVTSSSACFNNCTSLSNYYSIPTTWR